MPGPGGPFPLPTPRSPWGFSWRASVVVNSAPLDSVGAPDPGQRSTGKLGPHWLWVISRQGPLRRRVIRPMDRGTVRCCEFDPACAANLRWSGVLAQIPSAPDTGLALSAQTVNVAGVSGTQRGALAARCETGLQS